MILKLEQDTTQNDIKVSISYPQKTKTVDRIVSLIKSFDRKMECYSDDSIKLVNVSDIFYIESVDRKTIAFCKNESYQVRKRLYQVYEELVDNGFVQISKYCILNVNKLAEIKQLHNSHLEAILSNGTHLYVTRKYLAGIKQILQEDE